MGRRDFRERVGGQHVPLTPAPSDAEKITQHNPAAENSRLPQTRADAAIDAEARQFAQELGAAGPAGADALTGSGMRYVREYQSGAIYTDVSDVGNAVTYVVHGSIYLHYRALGGPGSWLGWPTADEQAFDGGRVSTFEQGALYWWPDSGAIDLANVVVRYRGLYCFGETDDDGVFTSADVPKVIFGVIPPFPELQGTFTTQTYGSVDAKESREDYLEIYRGLPYGMVVSATLIEVDEGDPNKYLDEVKTGVDKAGKSLARVAEEIPWVGSEVGEGIEILLKEYGVDLARWINDALGTADDVLDTQALTISPKGMVTLTRAPRANLEGIEWQLETPILSGGGASYKAYFDVVEA